MTAQRIDTLLGCIYDSVLLPEGFQSFIAALVDLFRLDAAMLLTTHCETAEIKCIWMQGWPLESISRYMRESAAQEAFACHVQASPVTIIRALAGDALPGRSQASGAASLVDLIVLRDGPWLTSVILQSHPHNRRFARKSWTCSTY